MSTAAAIDVDVCIVGSGPAGALLASQLAGTGKRIAIIEAGTRIDTAERQRRLDGGTEPYLLADNDPRLHVPITFLSQTSWKFFQIRKVGGNTQMWGGVCPRGLESQFLPRSTYGVSEDWPITYADLEPFYCQAEQELGVSGDPEEEPKLPRSQPYPMPPILRDFASEQFARACSALGYSVQTIPLARATQAYRGRDACRYCNVNSCGCCATTARYKSEFHLDDALTHNNVMLLTETSAAKLILGESGRVEELLCYLPDRSHRRVRAGVFVLAANALGNARLLLVSREHGRKGLQHCSSAAGRYYMGHPVYEHPAYVKTKVLAGRSTFTTVSRHFETGPHIRNSAGFRMFFNGCDASATIHGMRLMEQGLYGTKFKEALRHRVGHGVRATVITDCLPRHENGFELDPSNLDYFGIPGVKFRYSYSEYEENGRRLGAEAMARILDVLEGTKTEEVAYDMAHQLGTTRMGSDPKTSVVDDQLRVHDVDNLYVAGGSVFPTALGPTNPTLTIAALSLRLAQHLQQTVLS